MTMPKREVNSIWSKVREDRDIDDLIFNYEARCFFMESLFYFARKFAIIK